MQKRRECQFTIGRAYPPECFTGYSALVEQRSGPPEEDVLRVGRTKSREGNGPATLAKPTTRFIRKSIKENYALGRVVAVIEILSPGNKDSRRAIEGFVEKAVDFLENGIHLFLIDMFPPSPRDPFGIHKLVWDQYVEEDFLPAGKDRVLASYENGADERTEFVEVIGVGEVLPDMSLFLAESVHVFVPLEWTYLAAWNASPEDMQIAVETGVMPKP